MSFVNHLYNVHVATIWAHPHVSTRYNKSVYLRLTIFFYSYSEQTVVTDYILYMRIKYISVLQLYTDWANLNTNINKYNVDISPITRASTYTFRT